MGNNEQAPRKENTSVVDTWGDWVDNLSPDELAFLEEQDAADDEKYGPVFLESDNPEAWAAAEARPYIGPPGFAEIGVKPVIEPVT